MDQKHPHHALPSETPSSQAPARVDANALASLLADPALPPRALNASERSAMLAALMELVAAQSLLARQAMLLASYREDVASIERSSRAALGDALSDPSGIGAIGRVDVRAAEQARSALLEAVARDTTAMSIARAAIGFALRMLGAPRVG
ncbi:MAG: hypothetical protein ACTS3F_03100 [Phycisphaerales bacterium]